MKVNPAAIVSLIGGIVLFSIASVDLLAQEASVLDEVLSVAAEKLPQIHNARVADYDSQLSAKRWHISFHVGGTVGGPQQDLEDEMSRSGFDERSPGGFFGPGRDHPFTRRDVSGTASIRYVLRLPYTVGFIVAGSTTGETHGFQRGAFLGDFLFLRHSAISFAPVASAEFGAFDIGIGPALHRWKMEQVSGGTTTAEDTSWNAGFLVDAGLKGPARTRLFWDLRVQYRGAFGTWKIDSFQVRSTDAPVVFPSTELAYGHLFFGAGMGVRF